MRTHSIHHAPHDAHHLVCDLAIEPGVEVEPGAEPAFTVRDASDEQLGPHSTVADVAALDFSPVTPSQSRADARELR